MRRVGWQMQVRKDKVEEYKEAHRNVWPEAMGDLVEIPEGSEPQDVIVELEEVFHLD